MPVISTSVLVKSTESTIELRNLDNVNEGDVLVLKNKNEEWLPPAHMVSQPKLEPNQSVKNEVKKL